MSQQRPRPQRKHPMAYHLTVSRWTMLGLALTAPRVLARPTSGPSHFNTHGGGRRGKADGIGSAAQLNEPSGVTVDGAGNVFVADTANHTIRKVTPAGTVTTLAG